MKLDPERVYEALIQAGEDWSDKDAAASILEETKKSVLARIMNTGEGSIAGREMHALASDEYQAHIKSMVEARRLANRARVKWDSGKVLAELRRSEESTRRSEMNLR